VDAEDGAPVGEVDTSAHGWVIRTARGLPFVSSPDAMPNEIERRARAAAYPEPTVPRSMRRLGATPDNLYALLPVLRERAVIHPLTPPAAWPRPLVASRRQGLLTPLEAAWVLAFEANQWDLPAYVIGVNPSGGPTLAPVGYNQWLVQVGGGETVLWLDPGCTVCAPFEVRPELLDQPFMGPDVARGPKLVRPAWPFPNLDDAKRLRNGEGAWHVVSTPEGQSWRATGAEALELRQWHDGTDATPERIAHALGGASADPQSLTVEGLEDLGHPITVTVKGGGPNTDPLSLSPNPQGGWGPRGFRNRTWTRPYPGEDEVLTCERQGIYHWQATLQGGELMESLRFVGPLSDDAYAELERCRQMMGIAHYPR